MIRPVERAPVLTVVIVTLGLFFLVNGAARWIWSPEVRSLPNAFSTRPIDVAGVAFSIQDLGTIAVSLGAVALLWLFFRFTKLGLASRAAAVEPGGDAGSSASASAGCSRSAGGWPRRWARSPGC